MSFPFFNPREKKEKFLVLDIGTETVKTLILESREDKIIILAASLEYFDNYAFFDDKNFEVEIIKKAISKTFRNLEIKKLPENVFFGLPANILRGKIVFQSYKRKNSKEIINKKEAEAISQEVLSQSQKTISQMVAEESGILEKDLHFVSLKVLTIKIDGYQLPTLQGYSGENLVFRILTTFLLKDYFKNIENIIKTFNIKNFQILHPGQSLSKTHLPESENSIFLDIGGKTTQILLIKDGKLEAAEVFEAGGATFSQDLSQVLGISAKAGRELKERYSKKLLSIAVKNRISEILVGPQKDWCENLKTKIKEINPKGLLPSAFFLFGGGSLLPEIEEILDHNPLTARGACEAGGWREGGVPAEGGTLEGDWQDIRFMKQPEVKFIYPKDCYPPLFLEEGKPFNILNNPQYTPSLLIFYAYAR